MSYDIGSTTTKKVDPENVGVAVGISRCALELEICLGVILPLSRCWQTSQKTVARTRVKAKKQN